MEEITKEIIKAMFFIVLIMLGFIFFVAFIMYSDIELENETCNRYQSEYLIMTEFVKKGFLNSESQCYILMTDGTKIKLEDFTIASVKEPKRVATS